MNSITTRLPDWPERLADYLASMRGVVFEWGANDCAVFAAGAVLAITGHYVLPATWCDRDEAMNLLRDLRGLVPAVDAALPRLATPALAQRGDVVLVEATDRGPRRRWLAVCDGAQAWAPGSNGLVAVPMAWAVHAWGVGRCLPR